MPIVGRPTSLPTPRGDSVAVDDPLSSLRAGYQRRSASCLASSEAVSTSSQSEGTTKSSSPSATISPHNSFGASDIARPSWRLPSSVNSRLGECLVTCPASAQLVRQGTALSTSLQGGTLFLTNLRVLWEPGDLRPHANSPPGSALTEELTGAVSVHLSSIEKLRKLKLGPHVSSTDAVVVELVQKYNARAAMRLVLSEADCANTKRALEIQIGVPTTATDVRANVHRCYAVLHGIALGASSQRETFTDAFKGWGVFDAEREFHRQGLNNPLSHWRVSLLNQNYTLCTTYPALLVVPRSALHATPFPAHLLQFDARRPSTPPRVRARTCRRCVSDDDLAKAAAFRSGRRVPVLCWKDPYGVASICRSSQPMVGVAKARCAQDEALLQAIADTNPLNERLQIIDCRPRVNAEVNAAKGKGYEHQAQYVNTKLTFMSIENIHVMRASLRTFLSLFAHRNLAAAKEDDSYLSDLEKSGWMEHLRKLLRTAVTIVQMISIDRASVLVHCSDGWDRTAQVG